MSTLFLVLFLIIAMTLLGLGLISGMPLPTPYYDRIKVTDLRLGVEVQDGFGARLADRMLSEHIAELMDGRALAHRELRNEAPAA